jgi:hypothetical protein
MREKKSELNMGRVKEEMDGGGGSRLWSGGLVRV